MQTFNTRMQTYGKSNIHTICASVYTGILQFLFFLSFFLLLTGKKIKFQKNSCWKKNFCCSDKSSFTYEEETRQMRALFNLRTCESF